jgi:S1-C subfamily serine protease
LRALLALALTLLAACHPQASLEPPKQGDREFIGSLVDRAILIRANCDSGSGSGSGVILGAYDGGQLIATAAHVVDGDDCEFVAGSSPANRLAMDEDTDTALLWRAVPETRAVLGMADTYLGMPLVAVGWPVQRSTGAIQLQVSRGYLIADFPKWYRVDLPVYFGSSGGGAFAANGELVGLVVALIKGEDYAAPSEYFVTKAEHVFSLVQSLP